MPKPKAKASAAIVAENESPEARRARLWSIYWDEGESLATVAVHAGTTPEAVRSMFERMGKTLRPATFREPKFYREKAKALRLDAERFDAIADSLSRGEVPSPALLPRTSGAK